MERNHIILVVLGLAVCVALFFIFDIYASLIGIVLVIALAMSLFIMSDSAMNPDVHVTLKEDAKGIVVRNRGNAKAMSIRLTLVPQDIQYTIPSLDVEAKKEFPSDTMIDQVKILLNYQNETGTEYKKTLALSALDRPDDDLLKPAFPMFKWK